MTRSEFETLKQDLQRGAKEVTGPSDYKGRVFERSDGIQFGLRNSVKFGETIDIIKGNGTTLSNDFKVHFR